MAPKAPPRGGGVQVKAVRRAGPSPSSSANTSNAVRSSRKSNPSARYRKALARKHTHGGDFVKDDDAGRQFENRVLEVYAPADTTTESTRQVPLREIAKLEGDAFRPPPLSLMCLNVISKHFDTHILPIQYASAENGMGNKRINQHSETRRKGLLGIGYSGYDEEKDHDFLPSSDEEERRGRKRPKQSRVVRKVVGNGAKEYLQVINSYSLGILAPQLTLQLQQLLERKAPHLLTYDTLSRYFLSPAKVSDSRTFRVLAIVGGVPADEVIRLYKRLFISPDGTPHAVPKVVRPNAATSLRSLHLQAFTRLTSRQLEPLLNEAVNLEEICLRGCVNVTSEAMAKLVASCGSKLRSVNVNWTSVGLAGVEHLVRDAPQLATLKIAHVQGLTDANVSSMMSRATQQTLDRGTVPLAKLRNLKLNGTQIGITGVASLLKHCGSHMQSLDIGNTRVGGSGCIDLLFMALGYEAGRQNHSLGKINLSQLEVAEAEFLRFLRAIVQFEALRSINLNFIRTRKGSTANGLSDSMMKALMESVFARVEQAGDDVYTHYVFDKISIATNSVMSDALRSHIFVPSLPTAGTSLPCKMIEALNLSGVNLILQDESDYSLHGHEMMGNSHYRALGVEELNLHGCKLPERFQWACLGVNGRLRSIDLSGTAVSREMVDEVIRENSCLGKMDLTGCRSIPVRSRRDYFAAADTKDDD